ncbi:uncharacterized protein LOC126719666 [Quercus robur]|uniref:uncharacterized protein LOC126719666 n=1 Tax=Quercus robur TaxID=38942 RepID=UPI002163F914|nr:uncharacterized protein LOC126719666 [Quercus robur]
MQPEIDDLKRKLHHAQQRRSRSRPDMPSDDESDDDYRQRSRTPPSKTFSHEEEHYRRRRHKSPSPRGLGNDAMSRALDQLSKSPFTHHIEGATLLRRFQQPTFTIYNGKTDPVEHVSQFNQRMAVHSKNEALMCKVFPSSLGPVAMRWFNNLKTNSIGSYRQLTQAFGSHFVTNSRAPWPLSALLSLFMQDGETLKAYSDRYWETYNEMKDNFDDVAIIVFKNSHPADHGLRKSLTGKPATSMRQLMDRIDKYKLVEEDQLQGKGKEKYIECWRKSRTSHTLDGRIRWRESPRGVIRTFIANTTKTTENCRNLWNYLDQLVREGKLKHLLHHSSSHQGQAHQEAERDAALRPPAGMINVIVAAPGRTGTRPSRVLSVAQLPAEESQPGPKRARMNFRPVLSFSEEDKVGTIQPHDDVLLITLKIGDYDVKRVMVDVSSAAEVMYPDLYKGLGLKPKDLIPYNSPLMSFNGKLVIPKSMIRLPIQTGPEIVEVNFIVVDTYSPYTAIVNRPWLHTLGAVASSLHQKVKFPSRDQVFEIRGCQSTARQCVVATVSHRLNVESSASAKKNL